MTDSFPATVRKSGTSKVVVIPAPIATAYSEGETVNVSISKRA